MMNEEGSKFKFDVLIRDLSHFNALVSYMCRRAGRTSEKWTFTGRHHRRQVMSGPIRRTILVYSTKFNENDLAIIKLL